MDNPENGTTQPALGESSEQEQSSKVRTYKTPSGESFQVTEEEFAKVVELFSYLKRMQKSKETQLDTLEPELSGLQTNKPVNCKVW